MKFTSGSQNMQVRKANLEDLKQLSALFDGYRQFYKQEADINGAKAFLKQRIENEESVLFVVEEEGQLLGFTQLYPSFSSVSLQQQWILNDLFVSADARRAGVAEKLMNAANRWAIETGSKGLALETDDDNTCAQNLYQKLGYKKDNSTYHYFLPVQQSATEVL